MWTAEHSIETSASPQRIWELWADVPGWPEWNEDLAEAELHGPLAAGSRISMTSVDGNTIELRIAEAEQPNGVVDEANLEGIAVRTIHRAERLDSGRTRVLYRMEITGENTASVGVELGPQFSGDFPEVLAALAKRAER